MAAFIRAHLGDLSFEELPRRFAAVACDLMTGQRVVLDSGPVAQAVRASAAIPGLFSPIEVDGQLLVDGGVVDNLPVTVARQLGADYVIAVDVMPATARKRRPANMVEVLIAASNLMQARAALPDPDLIDCYIHPAVDEFSPWDFAHAEAMEALGRTAAEAALPQLQTTVPPHKQGYPRSHTKEH